MMSIRRVVCSSMMMIFALIVVALFAGGAQAIEVSSTATLSSPLLVHASTLDIANWLNVIGLASAQDAFLSGEVSGATLVHASDADLRALLHDDQASFDTVVREMALLKSRLESAPHPHTRATLLEAMFTLTDSTSTIVHAPASAGSPAGATSDCASALLTAENIKLLHSVSQRLAALALEPASAVLSDDSTHAGEQRVGCPRMLRLAAPSPSSSGPARAPLFVILGAMPSGLRKYLRTTSAWARAFILSVGESTDESADKLGVNDAHLSLPGAIGACALYHSGLIPDVVYVQESQIEHVFVANDGKQVGGCGCKSWFDKWSHSPLVLAGARTAPLILGDLENLPVAVMNNVTANSIRKRIVVDAPCWAVASDELPSAEVVAQAQAHARITCGDSLPASLLPASTPLVSAYMVIDPSSNIDRLASRVAGSLASFAPFVDNILLIQLNDAESSSMSAAADLHARLKDELKTYTNLKASKIVHWNLEQFENSHAKLRNAALRILSGLDANPNPSEGSFNSVFILQVEADELIIDGSGMRSFLFDHVQLCGPSSQAITLSILRNATALSQEPRVFRSANHLALGWNPDASKVDDPDLWGYVSRGDPIYVNWRHQRVGYELLHTGRAANAESRSAQRTTFGIAKKPLVVPVARLVRQVGEMMAQESELDATIDWWNARVQHAKEAKKTIVVPVEYTSLREHIHESITRSFEVNGQINEAYEYSLKRMAPYVASPASFTFQKDAADQARLSDDNDDKTNVDLGSDRDGTCAALYKVYTLHSLLTYDELELTLLTSLDLAQRFLPGGHRSLGSYYLASLAEHCADTQMETMYAMLEQLVLDEEWTHAAELVQHMQTESQANKLKCKVDITICETKLPKLIEEINAVNAANEERDL